MRLLEEAEHAGQIHLGNVTLSVGLFKVFAGKMSVYERALMEAIVTKYKEIEACKSEEEVSKIDATSGLPNMIRTTNEELQAELEENEHNSAGIQAVSLARSLVNDLSLPANKALEMQVLYPVWGKEGAEFGKEVKAGKDSDPGFRFNHKTEEETSYTLYEVIQDGILQENWVPGTYETYSIYKVVDIDHSGTEEDPIPYRQGMAFEEGKYYIQYGVTYLCILTTANGYPNDLAELNTIVQPI